MYQRRVVGLVLAITATATILSTLFARWWWVDSDESTSVHVGLRSGEVCQKPHAYDDNSDSSSDDDTPRRSHTYHGMRCNDGSLRSMLDGNLADHARRDFDSDDVDEPEHVGGSFIVLGTLAFLAGLGACIALIVAAATSGGPARPRPAAFIGAIACGAYAALALAFVLSAPSQMTDEVRAGPGLGLALCAAIAGILGSLCLGRSDPAREPSSAALAEADRTSMIGRAPALIAGVIGATLILVSLFTDHWFHGNEDDAAMSVGLQEVEVCNQSDSIDADDRGRDPSECVTQTIPSRVDRVAHPTRFKIFLGSGTTTVWTGIAVTMAFGLIALLVLLRQGVGGLYGMSSALFGSTGAFALSTLVYTFAFPSDEIEHLHVFIGPFLALGGAGCLLGSGVMLRRWMHSMRLSIPMGIATDPSQPAFAPMPGFVGAGMVGAPGLAGVAAYGAPAGAYPMMAPPGAYPPGAYPPSPFAPPQAAFPPPPPASPMSIPLAPSGPIAIPGPSALMPTPNPFAPPPPPPSPTPTPMMPPPYAPVPPPAPAVVIPACPRCATPMLWVSAKSTWLCTMCKNAPPVD